MDFEWKGHRVRTAGLEPGWLSARLVVPWRRTAWSHPEPSESGYTQTCTAFSSEEERKLTWQRSSKSHEGLAEG